MAGKNNTTPVVNPHRSVAIDPGTMAKTLSPLPGVLGTQANSTSLLLIGKVAQARRYVYSRPKVQALSLEDVKACSQLAYNGQGVNATPGGRWVIIVDSSMKNGVAESWITGFRAILLEEKTNAFRRVVLAFAGTDPHSVADIVTDIDGAVSLSPFDIPAQYAQAASLAEKLQNTYGPRLLVAGHSLGGGLANYVSVKLGIPGAGINAAPLGPGTILNLYLFGKDDHSKFTHYNNEGELVSSYAPGVQIGQVCEIENKKGVLEGHMLENIDTNAPMVCYDDYLKRSPTRGVTGTW
jgi:hypothetical protein